MLKSRKIFGLLLLFINVSFSAQEKPNILWITIEDTSPQFIGCYGNEDASTPNIDKLAKEGIRFTNAFSTGTVCSPSRSTIITGVPTYKMGTGNQRSNYPIPPYINGFPFYLKEQGYYTSNNYKTDYNIANEKEFVKKAWDESSNEGSWSNKKDKNKPFFSVFNFSASHQSRTMSMPFDWYKKNVWNKLSIEDRIGDNAFEMPPFYRDTPEMRKQFARVYNSIKLTDNRIGELLKKLEEDGLAENTIIFFFADHGEGIPRGKANGINLGYRVPFIIKFPDKFKHLSPWGEAGIISEELVSFEDLAPTMVNIVGGKTPGYMEGRILIGKNRSKESNYLILSSDRVGSSLDLVRSVTDGKYFYSRNFMSFMSEMKRNRYFEIGDITKQMRKDLKANKLIGIQKQIFERRPVEFLFNIEEDIWETNNLINDNKVQNKLKNLRHFLNKKILKSIDIHFLPEYEVGLISKNKLPYEFRLNTKNYPFKSIYESAKLSGKIDSETLNMQLNLLNSNNKIVRYWASVGLISHSKESLKKHKLKLISYLKDSYSPVEINIATVLYDKFNNQKAKEILIEYSNSKNLDLALATINNLLHVSAKLPFKKAIQNSLILPNRNNYVKGAGLDFLDSLE